MSTDNAASTVLLGMGKGSGIDIRKLAQDLTDVEKAPRESRLNADIEASEAKISGLAVLKYNVQLMVDQFALLNDASELATPKATSADTTKVSITSTDGSALSGISDIGITSLAAAQRNKSNQYSSTTQSLNSGSAFTLTLTPGTGTATNVSIEAGNDTPQGVVNAINAANAGVNATLLAEDSSGSNYRIMLVGATGATNSFVVSSTLSDSDLGFHDTSNGNTADNSGTKSLQNPADAALTYNGVSITRSSNS
ncbi:MAG: flagellar cap protein FliD N-terminal domain-containing protein, partial [Luminiphilus sp.]|nr:flagellar cap protein FliD N-terminal domain-containing protein [Luminiphilus sp.]